MTAFSEYSTIGAVLGDDAGRAVLTKHLPWVGDFSLAAEHPEFPIGGILGLAVGWDSPVRAAVLAELAEHEDPTVYPQRRPARELAALSPEQQAAARLVLPATSRVFEPVEVTVLVPGAAAILPDVEAAGTVTLSASPAAPSAPERPGSGAGATAPSRERAGATAVAFHDRGDALVLRFLPEQPGTWRIAVSGIASEEPLEAEIDVAPADETQPFRHGPVWVIDGRFQHADGTAYTPMGTTAYAWIYSSEDLRRATLESLAGSGFNKIRMCVFPKHYDYNHADPERVPFRSAGDGETEWDWDAFDPEFFDTLEWAVRELGRIGIVADLILFHPYDRWGFSSMTPDVDDAYLRHVVRRLAAFPNVFWSMANEYELLPTKRPEDWDRLGRIVAEEDPVGHPIGVHNIFAPFDASAPWVSHVSFQGGGYEMAAKVGELRGRFGKPVVVDEYGYEGNLEHDWGNLTAEEELRRFWVGVLSGAGMTHGETYFHEEYIWWANGGRLEGGSAPRIAFLRRLVEEAPRGWLAPVPAWGPVRAVDGEEYQLLYLGGAQPYKVAVTVPEGRTASIDVIDTWAMTVKEVVAGARGTVDVPLPSRPWMAVRVRCD